MSMSVFQIAESQVRSFLPIALIYARYTRATVRLLFYSFRDSRLIWLFEFSKSVEDKID